MAISHSWSSLDTRNAEPVRSSTDGSCWIATLMPTPPAVHAVQPSSTSSSDDGSPAGAPSIPRSSPSCTVRMYLSRTV